MEDSKGITAKNNLYNVYRHNASKRGLQFDLSKAEFYLLTKENCFYCGATPNRVHIHHDHGSLYYTEDNCVPCCHQCNMAKWTLTSEEFDQYIKLVYTHMIEFNQIV
jgi:5-methylcytosine-specific restriction endonuclease McrA